MRVACGVLSLLALSYVVSRAITVDATYDEVSTIFYFVPESAFAVATFAAKAKDAGNHVLNTLLIKLLFATGAQSLFVARLPNVCAFAVYLYFGYRIARHLDNTLYAVGAFLLLILNPFLLDFFSLARGYGLALGAQAASMCYLLEFVCDRRTKWSMVFSLLAAAGAVICALPWLHYFVAVAIVGVSAAWLQRRPGFAVLATLVVAAGLGAVVYIPIRRLQQSHLFFYGGNSDFYHDTLLSLAKYSTYSPVPTNTSVVALNVALVVLVVAVCVTWVRRVRATALMHAAIALLLVPVLTVVTQHSVLGTLYPIDRAALFYYPLFVVALTFSVAGSGDKPFVAPGFVALVMAAAFNLASHANLYKSALWSFDAHATTILSAVNDVGAAKSAVQRLDFAWPFEQSITYHLTHGNYPFVQIVERPTDPDDFDPDADFYIHLGRPLEKFAYEPHTQKVLASPKRVMMCFADEAVCVFRLR